MARDEIVEEIRRARHALMARYGNDMEAMAADMRQRARDSGRTVVTLEPKRPATPKH
jgi:hypothetical protein